MTLRDLTPEEVEVLSRMAMTEWKAHINRRTLTSRGPQDHFLAGFNACLKVRLALVPKRPSGEPMVE